MPAASPLTWPAGWPRTPGEQRTYGRFGKRDRGTSGWAMLKSVTVADGTKRVLEQLQMMRCSSPIISTNLKLRKDGLPLSDQREPADPGVAVYWTDRKGTDRCIALDRYSRVADNLAAVAATLEAMRAIERHGGSEILDRTFTGFTALEHTPTRSWWVALGVPQDASAAAVESAYRRLRSLHHPDRGGDADTFHEIQQAYAAYQQERASA